MTADELRAALMKDADSVTDSRVASWAIGKDGVRRVRALRRYWESATAAELQRLLDLLNREP